jgi:hypothetical protein
VPAHFHTEIPGALLVPGVEDFSEQILVYDDFRRRPNFERSGHFEPEAAARYVFSPPDQRVFACREDRPRPANLSGIGAVFTFPNSTGSSTT